MIMNQDMKDQNGIYEITGPEKWERSLDFQRPQDIRGGSWVYVVRGREHGRTCWTVNVSAGIDRPYVIFQPAWVSLAPLKKNNMVYRLVSTGPHHIEWRPDPHSSPHRPSGEYMVTAQKIHKDSQSTTRIKAWVVGGKIYWDDDNAIKQGRYPPNPKTDHATWEKIV